MSYRDQPIRLVGGRTCLDFLNTADWSTEGQVVEDKLAGEDDLSLWCRAMKFPAAAGQAGRLEDLRAFRASLRRIFLAALKGEAPSKGDLAALNEALASIPNPALRVVDPPVLTVGSSVTLQQAIAVSAMAVLSRETEIARVRICPGDSCAWLFLDESRNRRRRWCSMETCGNREKARRHYQRSST